MNHQRRVELAEAAAELYCLLREWSLRRCLSSSEVVYLLSEYTSQLVLFNMGDRSSRCEHLWVDLSIMAKVADDPLHYRAKTVRQCQKCQEIDQ